ncbi:DNRLRE domain-containing protein [Streptomyces sp. NPDC055692]|uniref:DNRLRE domain-containing protein n=1 Tax=Streptomyces sp. NPDC055692 TaxID=3155683 RepID=UPI00343BC57A
MAAEVALVSQDTGLAFADATAATSSESAQSDFIKASGPAEAQNEASAMLMARLQDRKIEVLSARTADSTTYALPSGELETEAYAGPIRVKQDGKWKDIDTTLSDTGDALQPQTAAADITVSNGGDTQLASVAKGKESFGLGWQDKLPAPSVKDDTASYNLGGGQTLSVTALAQGFSENIKLAQQPDGDAVSYRIPLNLDGLRLSQADSGHLLLKNTNGDLVAEAPAPMMWDASKDEASGESAHQERVDTKIETANDGSQTLVLTPDKDFLATATYPVTVDPTTTLAVTTDTWIQYPNYPDSQVGSQELKSGSYDAGAHVARTYLKFDVSKFTGKHITGAKMSLYNYYSATCDTTGATTTARRVTSAWDSHTIVWGSEPTLTTVNMAENTGHWGYSASCPANWSHWTLTGMVQDWADGRPNYGIGIRSANQNDSTSWRRFRSANYTTAGYAPKLVVDYNSVPATPSELSVSPLKAGTTLMTAGSLTPTLQAKVNDSDADSSLVTEFRVEPDPAFADTTYTWTGKTAAFRPGTVARTEIPTASALPDGSHLRMRARTSDRIDTSAWSGWESFRVDATAVLPADLPTQLQAGATDTTSPLLTGIVTSPNGGMVEAEFRLGNATGTQTLGTQLVPNGERAGFQIPANRLTSGGPFDWSMRACYEGKCSAWTAKTAIVAGSGAERAQAAAGSSVDLTLTTATVCTDSDACVGETGTALKVGSVSGKNWLTYLRADMSKIPAGARVTNAVLKLQSSATTPDLDVHALNEAWATTGTGGELDSVTAPEAYLTASAPWTIDVTGLVTGWADGANANHGLVLRKPDAAPSTAGISFTSATLTVEYGAATPPSPPTAVRARAADRGALVMWGASEDSGYNDTLLTYEVTAVDPAGVVVAKRSSSGRDVAITGLTNGTPYTFRVSASNPYGTSDTVTSEAVKPLSAPLNGDTYTQAVSEYLQAGASLTTGTHNSAGAAVNGRPHAGMYSWLLKAEESWLIDTRDALKADDLTYTSITSDLSDALVLPSADGSVSVRATVSEQRTLAEEPSDPETSEVTVLYTFSGGDAPVLRNRMNAEQYEQQLAKDDDAFGTVTFGTVENDGPDAADARTFTIAPGAFLASEAQYGPYANINASGTATWAKKHWNDRAEYSQDCTNFVSKALYHGGGMRMKGVRKDKKSVDNWWRVKYSAPPHSGGGFYYENSQTWTVADKMREFVRRNATFAVNTETKQKEAKVGDVVFFNWGGKGGWDHAGVVTKMYNGKAYVSAHNNNRLDQRLDVYVNSRRGTWADIVRIKPGWY